MGRDIRCPHCGETFLAVGAAATVPCAACGKVIVLDAKAPPAPPASGPPKVPGLGLRRTCPSCGAKFEGTLRACPKCGADYRSAKSQQTEQQEAEAGAFGAERAGVRKGVMGGVIMMVIAVVWFVVGWAAGAIFYYPPILFVIGLYALIKGLATGNYAGEGTGPGRGAR